RKLEAETGQRLFEPVGVAWFDDGKSEFTASSEATLRGLGIPCERLNAEEARRLYPSLDVHSVLFEPDAGVLHARRATEALARGPRPQNERLAREYAARRFPALADAPVVGTRVCQYDLTPDAHFLVARHPEREDWWLVGGGSGHGFKHGPALAEYLADCVES